MIDHNWNQSCVYELYATCYFCKQQTIVSREHKYEPGDVVTCANAECGNEIKLSKEPDRQVNYVEKNSSGTNLGEGDPDPLSADAVEQSDEDGPEGCDIAGDQARREQFDA